jgi:hypothetical protein
MGIDYQVLKFLLAARQRGVSFERFAMIGRQTMRVDPGPMRRLLRATGIMLSASECSGLFEAAGGYAEPLLRLLGAKQIDSLDASSYEQATIVHDMNLPIADLLKNRFTAVLDGGSLEHVFNVPCALRNCMEMVALGGHYLGVSPTNNWMGHGFYQFSPELFFRVLSPANGFEEMHAQVCETAPRSAWFEVRDPAQLGSRVYLVNGRPTYLFTSARRAALVPVLAVLPQQSDYSANWQDTSPQKAGRAKYASRAAREWWRRWVAIFRNPYRSKGFQRIA